MEVNIHQIDSTVKTYDPESMLTPRSMSVIVRAVMEAMDERDDHRERVAMETRVNTGIIG